MSGWFGILWYTNFALASICANMALNITRGTTDKFTNPRCVSGSCTKDSTSINCDGLNGAYCITQKCCECQCDANNPTFYGKCVKNERLSRYLGDSHSFLANHLHTQRCMVPLSDAVDITVDTCDLNDISQHWIWTKHNQLLNLYTLKCLQISEIPVFRNKYPKVWLTSCNASDSRQIWECRGKRGLVHLKYEKPLRYLNYGNGPKYVIVFSGSGSYSLWKRCQSNQLFCSTVSAYQGCYKYSDGSNMFTIKTEALNKCEDSSNDCEAEKHISAPIEVTNHHCFIQWKRTEFLNYSQWHYPPESVLDIKPFQIVKRNSETIALKVDLAASQHLRGQIIRLYIACRESERNDAIRSSVDQIETHCVLVKFSGNFRSLSSVQLSSTPTAGHTVQTGSMSKLSSPATGNTVQIRNSLSTTLSTIFMANQSTTVATYGEVPQTGSSSSTAVIIIVICVTSLLLLVAIILFVVFKRRRCRTKETNETRNDLYECSAQHLSVTSAETLNPVYSTSNIATTSQEEPSDVYEIPVEAASTDCALYASITNENVYHEPQVTRHTSKPASELTYDYAKPDGMSELSKKPL